MQYSTYPIQYSMYPIQYSTYPIQNSMYPIQKLDQNLCISPHTQVGLLLYLAKMFKAMKASSRELQAQLEKNSTPSLFPKVLPAKKIEWERLQSMDLHTLLASLCI